MLADGGHYEYSSSYHLLMTKLLAEIIIALKSADWPVPEILKRKLEKMLEYSQNIRLLDGSYPLWNDASFDSAPGLDTVLWFGSSLIEKTITTNISEQHNPLLARLLKSVNSPEVMIEEKSKAKLTKLAASGYYLLKSENIELSFDAAPPCPKELPGHAHADCLSFNIYKDGKPLIIETGTSQYGAGKTRNYERSTAAHNTIVFNNQNQSEIWGGFRVGRKAQPRYLDSGQKADITWLSASHDGYDIIAANHYRWIGMFDKTIIVLDQLSAEELTAFSSYLHFAPSETLSKTDIDEQTVQLSPGGLSVQAFSNLAGLKMEIMDKESSHSYYSPQMGRKFRRARLKLSGQIKGTKIICMIFHFDSSKAQFEVKNKEASLQISDKSLKWIITKRGLRLI